MGERETFRSFLNYIGISIYTPLFNTYYNSYNILVYSVIISDLSLFMWSCLQKDSVLRAISVSVLNQC